MANENTIPEKFLKPYNPQETEDTIYKKWLDSGYFSPDVCVKDGICEEDGEKFSIVLPPPNVTGVLHLGHAYEDALQDTIIRYQRMHGKKTLWIPGTDSAAIATQSRVEKNIQKKEKKSRHDLGREELVKRVEQFALDHENIILDQVKKVGTSLDWSRYAYTLDDVRYKAVMTAFKNMYDAGLIYRGYRIINWDPKGQTTISDDEIEYQERKATFYTFTYSKDFPIAISTTRPETKVGDTAVAVHPDDKRYKKYIGKEYDALFCDVPIHIKIVADIAVDPEFGTGAVGVTPAHSMVDWDMGERHELPVKPVINEYARMSVDGRLKDKKVSEARDIVAAWLNEEGLLQKEEEVDQNVSTAERTGAIIEPLPKLQWFIAVDKPFTIANSQITGITSGSKITLKELMRKAVEGGDVSMPQERFRKTYFHWIDNLHDWCISRQIWFGHRIPVWYKKNASGEITDTYCDVEGPKEDGWEQESDVLDTWFSSSLWTFSTLGWPKETDDLKTFHPTDFMSPAYEILNLWVSRMILMSGFHLGQVPFKEVLIHGLVRDKQGKKFSKSLGNGIDPLDIIAQYGADALRMGLVVGTAIGNDVNFDENKIRGYKKFANKMWNASRFVLTQLVDFDTQTKPELSEADTKILNELDTLTEEVSDDMENYRLHLASDKLYHYFWHTFADIIIEESKPRITDGEAKDKASAQYMLWMLLTTQLKLLHPFMPFVTEEIWGLLPGHEKEILMVAKWPTANKNS